jgi:DNA-binding transcriptional LysR family regulator
VRLFRREGRNIRLTTEGQLFLSSVRESMRHIEDGVSRLENRALTGMLHLTVAGPFNFTMPAVLEEISERHPEVTAYLHGFSPGTVNAALLRGDLDLAFTPSPADARGLLVEKVGMLTHGVYCGPGHPLARMAKPRLERILAFPFVAPVPGESGPLADGWPPEVPREVKLHVQHLNVALAVCAGGKHLALFPDRVAEAPPWKKVLRRLPLELASPTALYAVRRSRLGATEDLVDFVIEAARRHWRTRS